MKSYLLCDGQQKSLCYSCNGLERGTNVFLNLDPILSFLRVPYLVDIVLQTNPLHLLQGIISPSFDSCSLSGGTRGQWFGCWELRHQRLRCWTSRVWKRFVYVSCFHPLFHHTQILWVTQMGWSLRPGRLGGRGVKEVVLQTAAGAQVQHIDSSVTSTHTHTQDKISSDH